MKSVEECDDRRAYTVRLTAAGRRAFRKMARIHEKRVAELLDGVVSNDRKKLITLLSQLEQQLHSRSQ